MPEFETYKNTKLFKSGAEHNLNIDDLASMCGLIQASVDFHYFDLALTRLRTILPLAALFNPALASWGVNGWLRSIELLLPETQSPWFRGAILHTIPAKQNSSNRLGILYKGHEFYAALIANNFDEAIEHNLIITLAVVLAVKALPDNTKHKLPSANQLALVADSVCKATQKNLLWDQALVRLISGETLDIRSYLENLSQRCHRFNSDTDQKYKQGQRDFSRALLACANALLVHGNWEINASPSLQTTLSAKVSSVFSAANTTDEKELSNESIEGNYRAAPLKLLGAKPEPSINFNPVALAPEDVEQWTTVAYSPITPAEVEPLSESGEITYGLYSRYLTELDNQYLPIRWDALNRNELDDILAYLETANTQKCSAAEKNIALLIALTLATGHPLESLLNFRIEADDFVSDYRNCLNRVHGHYYWHHIIPSLENRYQPNETAKNFLNVVGDNLALPLPTLVSSLLNQCIGPNIASRSLQEALNGDVGELKKAIAEQFKLLRASRRNRSSLARLRNVLFDSLMKTGGDEIAAFTVLGLECDRPMSGLYYTTFATHDLQKLYCAAIDQLMLSATWPENRTTSPQPREVGSLLAISPEFMQQTTEKLRERCISSLRGLRDLDKIRDAHNYYTSYVVMMLMFSTGHRAVNDPFHDSNCFFPNLNAVLITDKVELQEHEGRLVWLGTVAQAQYLAYLDHLEGLKIALDKYDSDLAIAIDSLIKPFSEKQLPLFFYLTSNGWESVKPASLSKELGDCWPLPLNANRHFLSTQLRRLNVPAEFISYQLGHAQIGQLAFGQFSELTPQMVGEHLIAALSELENLCNWTCLKGLRPYGAKALTRQATRNWTTPPFGPVLRAQKRAQRKQRDALVVRAAIKSVNQSAQWDQSQPIPDEFIAKVLAEIEKQSIDQPSAQIRRHNLFRRFLKFGRYSKRWHSSIPSLMIDVKGEKAPLTHADSMDIAALNLIKQQFVRALSERFQEKLFPPNASSEIGILIDYFAYCRLSALLLGQLCDPKYLESLEKATADDAQSYAGRVWINFFDKPAQTHLKYRWFPDELTTVLIVRMHQNLNSQQIKSIPSSDINKAVAKLIKSLRQQAGIAQTQSKDWSLDHMVHCVKKENALNFPGVVRAFLNGDVDSSSLPLSAWQRLLSGKPLEYQEPTDETIPIEMGCRYLKTAPAPSLRTDKLALQKLKLYLLNAQPASSGRNPNPNDTRNESQRRVDLLEQLKQWSAEWESTCSTTLICLHSWVRHLLEDGTRHKAHLKLSTIEKYFSANATALVEQCWALNLPEIEDDALAQVYENVLNYGKDSSRPYRAERLKEFHAFMVKTFGVASVEFDELEPRTSEYGADANIVTPNEYKTALHLLLNDSHQPEAGQTLHALLLCLVYRNGLRTGEAVRLLISDVITKNSPLIYVRNNRYGTCKSINGVRQIPFLERLDEEEQRLLSRWADHRQHMKSDEALAPFFTRSLHNNAIIIRQAVMKRITQALKLATGDPGIKIRHLRHSFATYFVLSAIQCESPLVNLNLEAWSGYNGAITEQFTHSIFGQNLPTRRMLYQLANLMGHGSPITTLRNYVHCLDLLVAQYRPAIPAVLSGSEMIVVLGYSPNSLRTTLSRLKLSATGLELRSLLPSYLERIPESLRVIINTKPLVAIKSLPPLPDQPKHPSLDSLAGILSIFSQGASIEFLAQRYFYSPDKIEQWIKNAVYIQQQTRYKRFKLQTSVSSGWLFEEQKQPEKVDNEDVGLIRNYIDRSFIDHIERRLNLADDTSLSRLVDIWLKTYKSKTTGFYSSTQVDAEALIMLLEEFGIEKSRIFLEVPKNFQNSFQSKSDYWRQWLLQQGIPDKNIRYFGNKIFARGTDGKTALSVPGITVSCQRVHDNHEETTNKPAMYFTTEFISYYLFLASVLMREPA